MKIKLFIAFVAMCMLANPGFSQKNDSNKKDQKPTLKAFGFVQSQWEYQILGEQSDGKSLNTSNFYFDRARVGVKGSLPYDFTYLVSAELATASGGPNLCRAAFSYNRFGPYAKITFGQFKSPFGLEQLIMCSAIPTIERSLVSETLAGPMRDIGIMISGGTDSLSILGSRTKNLFGYSIGLMNGTGWNAPDDNAKKDLVGRITFHPVAFLTLGASYRYGKHPQTTTPEDSERSRWAVDAEVNYKGFRLMGEYISGSDVGSYTTGGGCGVPLVVHEGSLNRDGFMIQGMYMTPWKIQPVLKVEKFDPNTTNNYKLDENSVDDIQNVITFGVNYFFSDWIRLQANYLYKAEESVVAEHENDVMLVQIQVKF